MAKPPLKDLKGLYKTITPPKGIERNVFKYWPILSSFCPFYFSIGVATKCEEISPLSHIILPGHLFNFEKIPHQVRKFGRVANLILRKFPIGSVKMPGL